MDQVTGSFVLTSVTVGLAFAAIYYHIKAYSYWSSRGIKGPTPWPLFGTTIYYLFRPRIEVDKEWSEKYGKLYGIYEGYNPVLRTTDNELIKFVFIKEHSKFTDRNSLNINSEQIARWLFFSKGSHWNNQRILITPLFTSLKMKTMFTTMSQCVDNFIKQINLKSGGDEKIYSKDDLMSFTLDVISKTFFGLDLNTYRRGEFHRRAFGFARQEVWYIAFYFLTPQFIKELFKIDLTPPSKYEYFEQLSQKTINEKRKNRNNTKSIDFVQYLIDAKLPVEKEKIYSNEDDMDSHYNDKMKHEELEQIHEKQQEENKKDVKKFRHFSDSEMTAQMTFFFLAGFETTSSSLGLIIYELSHKQDLQEMVYNEIAALVAESDNKDQLISYEQLANLKQLEAFISETLRLYTPVTEHSRCVTSDGGVVLPTNPPVHLPNHAIISTVGFQLQRDPDYWPEPLKFDISRFYPENRDKIKSATYMPFGLGPRNCVGMRFALMNIRLTIARLLLKYQVKPGPKSQEYPPKFKRHAFFTQLEHTDFVLKSRE